MRENAEHTQDWKLSEDIKTGFTVPESYFKGLEDDFLLNLSEKKLPKNNVFEIPKTYFEEFDDHIIEKIKPKKGKLINFKKIFPNQYEIIEELDKIYYSGDVINCWKLSLFEKMILASNDERFINNKRYI